MSNLVRHPSSIDLCHKKNLPLDYLAKGQTLGEASGLVGTEAISREIGV